MLQAGFLTFGLPDQRLPIPLGDSGLKLIFSFQSPITVARPWRLFTAFPNLNEIYYTGLPGSVKRKFKIMTG